MTRSRSRLVIPLALVLAAGCGAKAPPSDPPRPAATADAAPAPPGVEEPPTPPPAEAVAAPPPPRLAWVNPARCVMPCAYDPEAQLVRVDDAGVAAPAGAHRVAPSVEEPIRNLVVAAHAAGHRVRIESAFRSYDEQARLFKRVKQVGRAARPGHSEHQLGTAIDLRLPTSAAIRWLAEHAPRFGFALSYPDGKQRVTGYRPEPWHLRFVGVELALELRSTGGTLEELFRARPELGESGRCDDCSAASSRAACDAVTASGQCKGTVLQWCYDGALATVDCAASRQRCGRPRGADDFDCIGP
jgi:D-alanyl-D-alanine carboxypeptidase